MNRILHLAPIIIVILFLSGCNDDDPNTSHPEKGGIALTMNWPETKDAIPQVYHVSVISATGKNDLFKNLSGTTNNLIVEPGEAMIYVYNEAKQISVSEKKATVDNSGTGIASFPDLFYTYSEKVHTERDRDISQTATMSRQTGDLKISIGLKPAAMSDKVKAIHAVLEGVASELDMQTNELSAPISTSFTFVQNAYYATALIRTLGFIASGKQNIRLEIEFENGNTTSITNDLTSLLNGFNASKNTLFTLNASMFIHENASSATISNWECNTESRYLSVSPLEVNLPHSASGESVNIITDQPSWEYSVINTGDWLTVTKTGTQLNLSATQNTDQNTRQATIHISAGGLSETITVTQNAYIEEFYADKDVVKLQSATTGDGINIILLGDGYTARDMAKGTGKYEIDMRAATEHFFSVYPYTVYRDHFNVYMVVAVSNEEGISIELPYAFVDTKFESLWEGYHSTAIDCNTDKVVEYVNMIPELDYVPYNDMTVIMPINAYIYAGTCMMALANPLPDDCGYGEGFSISMCPVGECFEQILVHEAAGHGFAKARDEYIYLPEVTIPNNEVEDIKEYKTFGWCENVDFSSNPAQTSWSAFAGHPKYNMVGAFEGALMYGKGVWRPEYNSCMNNNVPYFNAPTRWAQVRRIKKLAGLNYSLSQFLQDDMVPEYPTETRSMKDFRPLGPPIIKKLNQKKTILRQ